MKLKKKTGGASIGDHEWKKDGDVVEVPDELGNELLSIDPDEYEHVPDKPTARGKGAADEADE